MSAAGAVAIDLDALGDTTALWNDWLASAGAVLGVDAAMLSPDDVRRRSLSPACTEEGYGKWFEVVNIAAAFLDKRRRDVELILAVPLPAEDTPPEEGSPPEEAEDTLADAGP